MNYSTAIFLINSDVRAIKVSYERDANGKGVAPFYTFKTFDKTLKVDDLVVIPTDTRHNHTVARVEETDVEIDYDATTQLKWVISKVDRTEYDAILSQEAEAIERIKSAEKRAQREALAAKLMADNPDLAELQIANVNTAALPAE